MREAVGLIMAKLNDGLDPNVALDNLPDAAVKGVATQLLYRGADAKRVAELLSDLEVAQYLSILLACGVEPDYLARKAYLRKRETLELLDAAGVSKSLLVSELFRREGLYVITGHLKWLYLNGYGEEIEIEKCIAELSPSGVFTDLDIWLWVGVESKFLLEHLRSYDIIEAAEKLLDAGVTISEIVRALEPYEKLVNFHYLTCQGAEIDPNELIAKVSGSVGSISAENVLALLYAGADPLKLAQILSSRKLLEVLPMLVSFGLDKKATPSQLFTPEELVENALYLSNVGFGISKEKLEGPMAREVGKNIIAAHFPELLELGFEVRELAPMINGLSFNIYIREITGDEKLDAEEKAFLLRCFSATAIIRNLEFLEEHGFEINIRALAEELNDSERETYLEELYRRGVRFDYLEMVKSFDSYQVSSHLPLLLEAGVAPDFLVNRAGSWAIKRHVLALLDAGANPNIMAFALNDDDLPDVKDLLLAHGADMWLT